MNPRLRDPLLTQAVRLAGPIAGAYLVIVGGLLLEYWLVGRQLGADGIAALGLAGTLALVLVLSFHAFEIAAQAIIARRFGEGNLKGCGACLDQAVVASLALGIPLAAGLWFAAPMIFSSSDSPRAQELALTYFRWRIPGMPLLIAVLSIIGFFNGVSRPTFPMIVYGLIIGLNAALCPLLIGGGFGIPALGIAGAGLSQSISAAAGFVVFVIILLRPSFRERYGVFQNLMPDWAQLGALLKLSAPVFVQQFLGNFGMYLFVVINARVPDGGVSLAASTLARQIGYLTYLPSLGFGLAAATLVGQQLGAGEKLRARKGGLICWGLGATFMVSVGMIFVFLGEPLARFFLKGEQAENSGDVVALAAKLLLVIASFQIFESINTIIGKALQGAGETRFVMIASVACQWGVFLPLAWALAIPAGMGAFGAMLALLVQLALVATLLIVRYLRGGWMERVI